MERVYNFSAGPSMLPVEVLEQASNEMLSYNNSGMSVMEMSHRSAVYEEIIHRAESSLREIMNIPDNYKILFLQGGASMQFAMIPLNLMNGSNKADYLLTGEFAKKAIDEGKRFGEVKIVASSEDKTFSYIPKTTQADFSKDADYVHITSNNTIFGTRFNEFPSVGDVPLVADMSSDILSREIDVTKFGLIYAGAQKNMGPSGLTVVIIREDLLGKERKETPAMLKYAVQAKNDSMYNTPPTYAIYLAGLVFEWVKKQGGVAGMETINNEKAAILYDYIDSTDFYKPSAVKEDRSIMNVTFVCPTPELDSKFVKEAEKSGFVNLKGHRLVGGMRASIYNAMPREGLLQLVEFMKKFEAENK